MTTPIRVACVGAGYFAQFHYDSWRRMPRTQLVGACDLDLARAQATGLPAFDDIGAMLAATQPDLVDIILPPTAQEDAIRTALAQGVAAIICQKPFGPDLPEAERLADLAEAAQTPLVIHENFRFQPWYRAIRAAMQDGAIGAPLQATFRLRPGDGQGPRAYLDRQPYFQRMQRFLVRETAVHWVDTFRFLLGDPVSVYADLRRLNPAIAGEDAGYILFDHGQNARALFDGNRHLDHAADNLRRTMGEGLFEGTDGILSLTGDGAVHLRRFGQTATSQILPPDTWAGFGGDCVHALQAHVVAGLIDGTALENTARDYLTVRRIEEAVYASAQTGQRITLTPHDGSNKIQTQ